MTYQLDPATSLGKVKLKVSNITRSVSFYETVIGLKTIEQSDKHALLTANGKDVLVELTLVEQPYEGSRRGHTGLYHFALLLPTRKALGNILKHFVSIGINVGQADHLVSEALYLSDPDQNGIEIYRDRPRAEWEYDHQDMVRMATDPIDWHGILAEADQSPFTGIDEGTIMGHIHLHVADLAKAKQYYSDVLGFGVELDWAMNGALFTGAGRYHHHIGLNIWNGRGASPLPSHATGLDYFTVYIASKEELTVLANRLTQAGYEVEQRETGFSTVDPFGIGIVFDLKQ